MDKRTVDALEVPLASASASDIETFNNKANWGRVDRVLLGVLVYD